MATPKLLIPGTGGAIFQTVVDAHRFGTITDVVLGDAHRLACKHEDPSKLEPVLTTGEPGIEMQADGIISGVYDPFMKGMPAYTVFPYDWRLDIRLSAQRLVTWLEGSGQGPWSIVCHSQGGLVLIAALQQMARAKKPIAQYVGKVVLVGVPMFGTVNAAAGLLDGVSVGGKVPPRIVRTWPAVYQMLPLWSIGTPRVAPQLYVNRTWTEASLWPSTSPPDLAAAVDPAMLDRARAYRLLHDVGFFEGLRQVKGVMMVFGKNLPTRAQVPKFPELPDRSAIAPPVIVGGDTLVPAELTWSMLPDWVQAAASPEYVNVAEHMFMCNELPIYQLCETYFSQ